MTGKCYFLADNISLCVKRLLPGCTRDFEKGFIRAETVAFDEFVSAGGEKEARERGQLRLEGKEYVVQEGDVLNFRFNV